MIAMNAVMKKNKAYWIGGTVTAFLGIALVRLVGPELAGVAGPVAQGAGFTLVIVGIAIITRATRRTKADAFITISTKDLPTNRWTRR